MIFLKLKFKVQDLTSKLHSTLSKHAESEYRANRIESSKQNFLDTFRKREAPGSAGVSPAARASATRLAQTWRGNRFFFRETPLWTVLMRVAFIL